MENRANLIAPCGIDCGICELYMSRDNKQIKDYLISIGIPEDVLPCDGCRDIKGKCPVIKGECSTYKCTDEKGVAYCSECGDFPCMKLAPAADRAGTLPHNVKIFNLSIIDKRGIEELIKKSGEIKQRYFKGKMIIGQGPQLEDSE